MATSKTTAKKKPTAAQLAARKLFAQRAKAGTLKKNPARKVARKVAVKKNPVRKTPVKRVTAVKKNPIASMYGVFDGLKLIGAFKTVEAAKQYAQALADLKNRSYGVRRV